MKTECQNQWFELQPLGRREVVAEFNGGTITSDAGGALLREVEERTGLLARFAACFDDHRDPDKVEHPVVDLLKQRIFGWCLGYEDLNDHDTLRRDPLLAVLVGKEDPTGQDRVDAQDRGCPLAGKSTLNRLELSPVGADAKSRYQKIVARTRDMEDFFVDADIALHPTPPEVIELDLDATDDPVHGHQLGRFFHGYYDEYCFLPLSIFSGMFALCAKRRPADIDAAAGAFKQVQRIVAKLRRAWPGVKVLVRGDGGFCRDNLRTWCEANDVSYLFGLPKNQRLLKVIGQQQHEDEEDCAKDAGTDEVAADRAAGVGRGLAEPAHGHRIARGLAQSRGENLGDPEAERDRGDLAQYWAVVVVGHAASFSPWPSLI